MSCTSTALPTALADSVGLRMTAGGTLGWLIGQPLFVGVTAVPAIILLVLLGAFGVLLISGIPLVEVPGRIRDAFDGLGQRRIPTDENGDYSDDPVADDDYRAGGEVALDPEADLATTRLRRPSRRRQAADADRRFAARRGLPGPRPGGTDPAAVHRVTRCRSGRRGADRRRPRRTAGRSSHG